MTTIRVKRIADVAIFVLLLVLFITAVTGYACTGADEKGCYCIDGDCIHTINGPCAMAGKTCNEFGDLCCCEGLQLCI